MTPCPASTICCTGGSSCSGAAGARSAGWKLSPADPELADLHVRDSRSLDLTWVACVPNLSSAPKCEGNAGQASSAGDQPRKTPRGLPSVHQDSPRQGRLGST